MANREMRDILIHGLMNYIRGMTTNHGFEDDIVYELRRAAGIASNKAVEWEEITNDIGVIEVYWVLHSSIFFTDKPQKFVLSDFEAIHLHRVFIFLKSDLDFNIEREVDDSGCMMFILLMLKDLLWIKRDRYMSNAIEPFWPFSSEQEHRDACRENAEFSDEISNILQMSDTIQ